MRIQVQKWGNSLAIRIPKSFALETKIERGSLLDLKLSKGKIIAEPLPEEDFALEQLLAKVTDENLHNEVDTGTASGREVW